MRERNVPLVPLRGHTDPPHKKEKNVFSFLLRWLIPRRGKLRGKWRAIQIWDTEKNNKHLDSKETIIFRENVQRCYSCFGIVRKKPFQEKNTADATVLF